MKIFRKYLTSVLLGFGLLAPSAFGQTDGSVAFSTTLYNYSSSSSSAKHYALVWVTNGSGAFITTLWKQGETSFTDGEWSSHCRNWVNAKGSNNKLAIDGYTSATALSYAATDPSPPDPPDRASNPINVIWNCRDNAGNLVPDGTYRFYVQYAENSGQGPASDAIVWTKGSAPFSQNYPSHRNDGATPPNYNFNAISVDWTPVIPPAPEIVVEQPAGSGIAAGGSKGFGSVTVGEESSLTFTIKNTGNADLTGLTVSKNGTNPDDFTVTSNPSAPVSGPSGSTTFIVSFAPTAAGARSAAIHIASNDADENPFDINLTGTGVAPFDAWASGLPPGQNGPQDTPQGDGVTNLLKFACNMESTMPDARRLNFGAGDTAGLPAGDRVGAVLRLEYLRRKAGSNPGISYTPQFSSDLELWDVFSGAETATSIDATWERVVIDDDPPPGARTRYGRVKVVLNP